jgi:predicted DNA-binding transcriptional regulator AlpA
MGFKRLKDAPSELGISKSTMLRRIADGTIPAPIKASERAVGWHDDDFAVIVSKLCLKPNETSGPPKSLSETWEAILADFAASPEYRASLPLSEAVGAAAEVYPQLAGLLSAAAQHEGLMVRKPRPPDYVVVQIDTGQWCRVSNWRDGKAEVYVTNSREDAFRPQAKTAAGLPKGPRYE